MSPDSRDKLKDFSIFLVAAVGYHTMGPPPVNGTPRLMSKGISQLLPKEEVLLYYCDTIVVLL